MVAEHPLKSLTQKLGIRPGYRIFVLNAPRSYRSMLVELPEDAIFLDKLLGPFDLIHFFVQKRKELDTEFPVLKRELSQSGALWVSWPKCPSRMKADLNESIVREIGLRNGLVDVKIIAVDEIWSGLKFVYRLKDRK
jgi:hypothetical protein